MKGGTPLVQFSSVWVTFVGLHVSFEVITMGSVQNEWHLWGFMSALKWTKWVQHNVSDTCVVSSALEWTPWLQFNVSDICEASCQLWNQHYGFSSMWGFHVSFEVNTMGSVQCEWHLCGFMSTLKWTPWVQFNESEIWGVSCQNWIEHWTPWKSCQLWSEQYGFSSTWVTH